ncbi:MAG: alkaline phosphatase family protein, partial [Bacteroidales bacterium]|nr:alkaline phosphatase family protein [Bacteroidales bacterium]
RSYLKAVYGEGDWILDYSNNQIYLNKTLIEDSQIPLSEFQEKVIAFIINSGGISNAISSTQMQNIIFRQGMPEKMQNSYSQKRSGDIMISLKAGWIEDVPYSTDHNSGYKYDTNVPLIWYGWKVKKQNIFRTINITDIAPTISMVLGTPAPPATTGESLQEVFNNR